MYLLREYIKCHNCEKSAGELHEEPGNPFKFVFYEDSILEEGKIFHSFGCYEDWEEEMLEAENEEDFPDEDEEYNPEREEEERKEDEQMRKDGF